MKRSFFTALSSMILLIILSGCSPELHERLLVRAIGVDLDTSGWKATVLVYEPGNDQKEKTYTGYGSTVAAALEEIMDKTGKSPMYSHSAIVIFGRTCAEQGLKNGLDFFIRHYDSRPNMNVFISDTSAEEILSIENDASAAAQMDLTVLTDIERYSSSAVSADLIKLINGTFGANSAAILPIIRKSEGFEIIGSGLFREMKLVGELNTETSRGILILTGKLDSGETLLDVAECGKISVYNRDCLSSISFVGTKQNPRFEIDVRIEGEISSIEHSMQPLPSQVFSEIEYAYANNILKIVEQYLRTAVINNGTDVTGLGYTLLHENPELWNEIHRTIPEFLKKSEYTVSVNAYINRIEEEDVPYY